MDRLIESIVRARTQAIIRDDNKIYKKIYKTIAKNLIMILQEELVK